jgi:hypothetical protein
MAAMILADALVRRGVEITVLESPTVEIIGVGEGSTPWMRGFFDMLGIEESEWMPACNATCKCGITFDKWSTKPGFESHLHPFASMLDNLTLTQFVHNAHARLRGADVHAHPNRFFVSTRLAQECKAPKPTKAVERELRESLGRLDDPTPARHLKMRIGRVTKHWNRNCLAVGLSQGFIEPLEATALLFIQRTVQTFVEFATAGEMDEAAQARFNQRMNDHFEGTRDDRLCSGLDRSPPAGEDEYRRVAFEGQGQGLRALHAQVDAAVFDGGDGRLRDAAELGELVLAQPLEFANDAHGFSDGDLNTLPGGTKVPQLSSSDSHAESRAPPAPAGRPRRRGR